MDRGNKIELMNTEQALAMWARTGPVQCLHSHAAERLTP
jgi:hypothetical protein